MFSLLHITTVQNSKSISLGLYDNIFGAHSGAPINKSLNLEFKTGKNEISNLI